MGCEVQIHEKTDKRGTWAYHCLDGWYLHTSHDHYRVHNCHVKSTKAERHSDTVHFHHKSITNPALTPHDKLMLALANCKAALIGLASSPADQQAHDLQQLIQLTETNLQRVSSTDPASADTARPRVPSSVHSPEPRQHIVTPPTTVPRAAPLPASDALEMRPHLFSYHHNHLLSAHVRVFNKPPDNLLLLHYLHELARRESLRDPLPHLPLDAPLACAHVTKPMQSRISLSISRNAPVVSKLCLY
jgi:hypothetical protein